ncbi:Scr1 family TA system antitoxin-like transcriptional regulator [Streptomyces millisiae]|uniref:Scr1 family TA system antitoxin-like transcriptional regulator n=1 Tax=Streptomyces millisiae TaxID=3075542 RepID=A0ABU2LL17_9ACTN|nr:Scr1 family TA system antitoxin-like transcriptional regulator [Streptomyces sp. DSM 44918]MDT0318281.1 Scr1 family TA system antitoxin-like transcriptional regulator [Streptomyces sp. DSM 44918]
MPGVVAFRDMRQLAANYACPDQAYVEGLASMAETRVGPDIQRRQLDRLLEESEHEHITIQVIPFTAPGYAGAGGAFAYAAGPALRKA